MKSALRNAVVARDIEAVRNLMANGAAVNETDENGWTALMLAAKLDQSEIACLLLDSGAAIETRNKESKSALDYAMAENSIPIIEYLLRNGASVQPQRVARISELDEAIQLVKPSGSKLDLLHACMVEMSEYKGVPSGFNTTLEFLLKFEPSENPYCEASRSGALLMAAQGGDIWSMRLLLDAGVNINTWGREDLTPLMLASAGGQILAVSLLLRCGADPNLRDFYGETALTLALQRKRGEIATLLINHGANVNVTVTHDGSTPLRISRRMRMLIMYLRLRRAGART